MFMCECGISLDNVIHLVKLLLILHTLVIFFFYRKLMKATVILMPLLGLTWLIGLLAAIPFPQPVPLILAAFFLVLNTLQVRIPSHTICLTTHYVFPHCISQGAFIFFFHVVRHDRIWPKLRRICFCIKKKKETTVSYIF